MVKPRMIILIRHAQSEGNKNRAIHQMIPDHRVKLTEEGWQQAAEAGHRLRTLLKPDDTLQIFTSPYRRTRETTTQIIQTLTDNPSPFDRSKINVYEEPRLREQDFGNFQPSSVEMERMWRERADYGHFFYRIPMGESAADAYDRIAGFNESLWRQFGNSDFPSVCVLVTHGLMTRVFLMKWYHWSVEYFEDLRNINHCEFVLMLKDNESGKYTLQNQMRTWSELKRQRMAEEARNNPARRRTLSSFLPSPSESSKGSTRSQKASAEGSGHGKEKYKQLVQDNSASSAPVPDQNESEDHPIAGVENSPPGRADQNSGESNTSARPKPAVKPIPTHLRQDGDENSTETGTETPHEMSESEMATYFDPQKRPNLARVRPKPRDRKPTPEDIRRWATESGMGKGAKADALGDEPDDEDMDEENTPADGVSTPKTMEDIEKAEEEDKSIRGSVF